jgi:hypothetical protein
MNLKKGLDKPFMTDDAQSARLWRDAYDYVMQQCQNRPDVLEIRVFARNEGDILF